ncbi:hypothetical protein [Pseudomonas fluorescens]|uniref:Uncharacterized protein n=1 Tax=Pseudomonas fluorescens TaxID=294 RepID=A0A0F4SZ86_PSEFL|nr:hypothetical protein [Pseudomonas fluorescens]KJZ37194.1 hypothetical protein VC34_26225 [Pseudomonas fluorescens]
MRKVRSFISSSIHRLPRGVAGTLICSSTASSTLQPIHRLAHALRAVGHGALYAKYPVEQINWARRTLRSYVGERISDAQVLAALDALSRTPMGGAEESQP